MKISIKKLSMMTMLGFMMGAKMSANITVNVTNQGTGDVHLQNRVNTQTKFRDISIISAGQTQSIFFGNRSHGNSIYYRFNDDAFDSKTNNSLTYDHDEGFKAKKVTGDIIVGNKSK